MCIWYHKTHATTFQEYCAYIKQPELFFHRILPNIPQNSHDIITKYQSSSTLLLLKYMNLFITWVLIQYNDAIVPI